MLTPLGFSLLRQLSDGAFHSGEDLAATVGLTRARVSQLLKQAETAGLALERVRGRGYRLLATPDFLDAAAIRSALEVLELDVAPPMPRRRCCRLPTTRRHPAARHAGHSAASADRRRSHRPGRLHVERAAAAGAAAATSTARCWRPNGRPPAAAGAVASGPPSPAAASRSRWAGASSRARASSRACRSRSASPSSARSKRKACRASSSSGRTTSCTGT